MGAIESETAAATAETTGVESLETEAPENGDRETKFQPRPQAATGALHALVPQLPGMPGRPPSMGGLRL
ncbi:MAG: hypothetical protein ACLQOO_29660 [Terriglobia bacterium]